MMTVTYTEKKNDIAPEIEVEVEVEAAQTQFMTA